MNILILGSGGREHALADKIAASPRCSRLFVAPGNAGTSLLATNLPLDPTDFTAVRETVLAHHIGLVIVGPEAPLVDGIVDFFRADAQLSAIPIIGPSAEGARLEGSKAFAKAFMGRHGIPTARYRAFARDEREAAMAYVAGHPTPIVLKADGLAAGKGVVICETHEAALAELDGMFSGKFGRAGDQVVIEQFLRGMEFSVFVLTDGEDYVLLPEAKDYKRIGEGDTGPNTGGMGAVSPVPFVDETVWGKVRERIIEPTVRGIKVENINYKGFIFFGLILVDGDPYVIEYNCRMGDPETEVVMPRLRSDLVDLALAAWHGSLKDIPIETDDRHAVTIMLVSGGYPGDYAKGKTILGLDHVDGSRIYHAGTAVHLDEVVTAGGRVIAVTSMASTLGRAIEKSLVNAAAIEFEGKYYRADIGRDMLAIVTG
jgi:phosphoribosylamine--glycine ligase